MPAIRRTRLMELVWKLHGWVYRTSALLYLPQGDACVVIASHAGEPRHPAWWLNLQVNPKARIQRGRELTDVIARETAGDERARIWAAFIARESSYTTYEKRTTRRIPVVMLEPAARWGGTDAGMRR